VLRYAAILAIALGLAACGGDASGEPPPDTPTITSTQSPSSTAKATSATGATATAVRADASATAAIAEATPAGVEATVTSPSSVGVPAATLVEAFPGLSLPEEVLEMHQVPGEDLIVAVSQLGEVVSFPKHGPFNDVSTAVDLRGELRRGFELGLLSIAFDPEFEANGYVYLYYSVRAPRLQTLVVRMPSEVEGTRLKILADERLVLLAVDQPFENHNGGTLAFGPGGMLYLGLGDGGSGGDPRGNGQDTSQNLLASVVRIDVRGANEQRRYVIPDDNPFVGDGGVLDETWAYGLRNPWRMSFDPLTGELWTGDVGQNRQEEVDIVRAGANYGWNIAEGTECFNSGSCDRTGLTAPVAAYSRDFGCTVIGGYVYRGEEVASLFGQYVYGDFCSGIVWALEAEGAAAGNPEPPVMLWDDGPGMFSFAVDAEGELYLLGTNDVIYRFAP